MAMSKKQAMFFGKGKKSPLVTGPSPSTKDPGAATSKRKKAKPTGGQASMTTAQQLGTGTGMKQGSAPGAKPW